MDFLDKLKMVSIFRGLTLEETESVIKKLGYKIKEFEKNETVFFRGDKIENIIINVEGELYTEMQKYNGDVIEVGIINEYDILASAFIFGASNELPVDVISKTHSKLIFLNKQKLFECMQENSRFLNNFLNEISEKSQFLSKRLWFNFVNKNIEDKIFDYIKNNEKNGIIHFKPGISHLAKRFGVTRPSLSRELSNFCSRGIIERLGKNQYKILIEI